MKTFSEKIQSNPNIHGFIFFSLLQFCYDKKFNIDLIEKAIQKGYTIYIAREKIVINNYNFKKKKKDLFFFKITNNTLINTIKNKFEK